MNFSKHFLHLKDYFLTQESFVLKQDPHSQLLKTFPQPEQLDRFYDSAQYLSHNDGEKSFFARCYHAVKKVNLRVKYRLIKKYVRQGRVLDIGAGVGDLVGQLQKQDLNAQGYEPNENARAVAKRKGIELHGTMPVNPMDFDLITMYHVLEHVPDVVAQLQEVHKLLTDQGYLILALPNYNSLDAQLFKKHWAGYDVPRHLYHFNKHAVKTITADYFELVETKPMWFDSFYVSILSAQYKKWPLPFLLGFFIGMCSNFVAIFTKEYSSITFILKKTV